MSHGGLVRWWYARTSALVLAFAALVPGPALAAGGGGSAGDVSSPPPPEAPEIVLGEPTPSAEAGVAASDSALGPAEAIEPEHPIEIEAEEGSVERAGSRRGQERVTVGGEDRGGGDVTYWESQGPDRVTFGRDIRIDVDQIVEGDVVCLGGDVVVDGVVDGQVISVGGNVHITGSVGKSVAAIMGDVELEPSAICGGDVVSVGGMIERNGAEVDGQTISIGFLPGAGAIPQLRTVLLVSGLFSLMVYVVLLLAIGAIFRSNAERSVDELRRRPLRSFGVGLLVHLAGPVALLLLLITLIGAIFSVLGSVALWLLAQAGLVVAGIGLGQVITGRPAGAGTIGPGLLGGFLAHIPILGGALVYGPQAPGIRTLAVTVLTVGYAAVAVMVLIGSGALVASRFGRGERRDGPAEVPETLFETARPVGERS